MQTKPSVDIGRQRIILASGSPRRKELLEKLGWDFTVCSLDVDESCEGTPGEMVDELAYRKALAASKLYVRGVVIGADTLVSIDGAALGKPVDEMDAKRMLRLLSGRTHQVYTGVCMIDCQLGRVERRVDITDVKFIELTGAQIDEYVATGEPMDKAGAYGIQGAARPFVESIDGKFENVMGLPIQILPQMMSSLEL